MSKARPQKPSRLAETHSKDRFGVMNAFTRRAAENELFEAAYDHWLGMDKSAHRRLSRVAYAVTEDHES